MNIKNKTRYSEEEYQKIIEKVVRGIATEEEKQTVQELITKGVSEVEALLDEDNQ